MGEDWILLFEHLFWSQLNRTILTSDMFAMASVCVLTPTNNDRACVLKIFVLRTVTIFLLVISLFALNSCSEKELRLEEISKKFIEINEQVGDNPKLTESNHDKTLRMVDSLVRSAGLGPQLSVVLRNQIKTNLAYNSDQRYTEALLYGDSTLNALESFKTQLPKEYFLALVYKGNALIQLGNYAEGLDCYHEARQFSTQYLDDCINIEFEEQVGNLFYAQQRYKEAIFFFNEALKQRELCLDDKNLQFYFFQKLNNNIGLSFQKIQEPDSALLYYNKALEVIEDEQYVPYVKPTYIAGARAVVQGNLGEVFIDKGDLVTAENLFRSSIATNKGLINNYLDALLTEIKLAALLIRKGAFGEAKKIIEAIEKESMIVDNESYMLRLLKVKWEYHDAKNEIENAYKAHLAYISKKDDVNKQMNRFRNIDISQSLAFKEKTDNERRLQETNIRKNFFLVGIAVLVTLLSVILWQYVRQLNLRKHYILELEKTNGQLNQSYKDLEQSLEDNDQLLRVVAHDLRNPISAIHGFSDHLIEQAYNDDVKEIAQMIFKVTSDTIVLIEEILESQGVEKRVSAERIDLKEVIEYSVSVSNFKAKDKNIAIKTSLESHSSMLVRDQIWRALINLIDNSIKFSFQNSAIEIDLKKDKDKALITIRDYGIGIPESLKAVLLEPNESKMRKGTLGEESNGLGLVLCKKLVQENNGKMWFESEVGKGTTFFITFPVA